MSRPVRGAQAPQQHPPLPTGPHSQETGPGWTPHQRAGPHSPVDQDALCVPCSWEPLKALPVSGPSQYTWAYSSKVCPEQWKVTEAARAGLKKADVKGPAVEEAHAHRPPVAPPVATSATRTRRPPNPTPSPAVTSARAGRCTDGSTGRWAAPPGTEVSWGQRDGERDRQRDRETERQRGGGEGLGLMKQHQEGGVDGQ